MYYIPSKTEKLHLPTKPSRQLRRATERAEQSGKTAPNPSKFLYTTEKHAGKKTKS